MSPLPWPFDCLCSWIALNSPALSVDIGDKSCSSLRMSFPWTGNQIKVQALALAILWVCPCLALYLTDPVLPWLMDPLPWPWTWLVSTVRLGDPWTAADPCCCPQLAWFSLGTMELSRRSLPASASPLSPALVEQPCFSLLTRAAHSPQGVGKMKLFSSRETCFLALLPGIALA